MSTKLFKIGESAKGGLIRVIVAGTSCTVINLDWDYSAGSRKSSDQSNAKQISKQSFHLIGDWYRSGYTILSDITTHYYADTILQWVKSKMK